jgi:hypothetical protein
MLDKLVVLSPKLREGVAGVARREGTPGKGYERCLDLRETILKLPIRLYYRGKRNGIHKAEVIGVASLGLPRTQKILSAIFPDFARLKIYRIDLCADFLGVSPWFFVINARLPRSQNFALYRSRGAVSFYIEYSRQRKIVFYDRLRLLRKHGNSVASIFSDADKLTRIEVQLMGPAVPFKRFVDLHRYTELDLLSQLQFSQLKVSEAQYTPVKYLAACGLRSLVNRYGQQPVSRMFSSAAWAALHKTYFEPMEQSAIPPISSVMKNSLERWLRGEVLFPRAKAKRRSGTKRSAVLVRVREP